MSEETTFLNRAEGMGLEVQDLGRYRYEDEFGEVIYRQLTTMDGIAIPFLGVFVKSAEATNQSLAGIVSDHYQFVGNTDAINKIKESIADIGSPIFTEHTLISHAGAQMYHEIVIRNQTSVPSVGDIYPQLIVTNGYNGTRAINVSFGISIYNEQRKRLLGFGFRKFGNMRQIHMKNAKTRLSSAIGSYVNTFGEGIMSMIEANMNSRLTEDDFLKTLELVEGIGKRRRESVSMIIESISEKDSEDQKVITRWNLFHAITRFSSIEKNINTRLLLENAAERCLVFPTEMDNVLKQVRASQRRAA